MIKSFYFKNIFLLFLIFFSFPLFSQNITGSHRGSITSIINTGDIVLSAGEDGFLVIWDINSKTSIDRFQLTTYKIQSIIKHPNKDEICVIEAVSLDNYRVSAWNFLTKEKLFTVYSNKPVNYINYSSNGSFIITSGIDDFIITILDSSTGDIILDPVIPSGSTLLAVTGRSERNMLIYQSDYLNDAGHSEFSGQIIYYDFDSKKAAGSFPAPYDISYPIIFANNRFLAGVNSNGLLIVDTTTGAVLDTNTSIRRDALLYPVNNEFYCLNQNANNAVLFRFSVDRNGKLNKLQETAVSLQGAGAITSIAYNKNLIFSSSNGNIFTAGQQNRLTPFEYHFQNRVTEINTSGKTIAALTGNGQLFFLPADYKLIQTSFTPKFTQYANYSRIKGFSHNSVDYYILWQTENTRLSPLLIGNINEQLSANNTTRNLNFLIGRFPLRSLSIAHNKVLILDSGGNITLRSFDALFAANPPARPDFTTTVPGTIDAALINNENIIIGRGVAGNNSPFLSVNIRTGETVPYFFDAQAGLTVFPAKNGNIYALMVEQRETLNSTFVNLTSRINENRLFEYNGEANNYSIAESSGGKLAVLCDSEGAFFLSDKKTYFERTSGLPVKLLSRENTFICLDSEGSISWYDDNGKLLAVFRLHSDRWTLKTDREITGEIKK
ncbi:MAG: hypothetical protein FWB73_05430 [Treponema sp.]|nr:hypothetical protein [Treponema sp.]